MAPESLLELTQLSVRQYTRPGGEVVALLVIAPSKGDHERVIPMSAELFHIVAAIIGRHTSGGRTIPALQRWDPYESTVGPALPYLFQNSQGPVARCNSVGWLNDALARICLDVAAEHPNSRDCASPPTIYGDCSPPSSSTMAFPSTSEPPCSVTPICKQPAATSQCSTRTWSVTTSSTSNAAGHNVTPRNTDRHARGMGRVRRTFR